MTEANSTVARRRISPGGIIDLPFTVRKALGFRKGEPKLLDVRIDGGAVRISPAEKPGPHTVKSSPKGLLRLPPEAHRTLSGGRKGRYALRAQASVEGGEGEQVVYLGPA